MGNNELFGLSNGVVLLDALKWSLLWPTLTILAAPLTGIGISVSIPYIVLALIVFFSTIAFDRTGFKTLAFIIVTYYLAAVIQRFQFGYGVGSATNYLRGSVYFFVLIALAVEISRSRSFTFRGQRGKWMLPAVAGFLLLAVVQLAMSEYPFNEARRIFQSITLNYLVFVLAYYVGARDANRELRFRLLAILVMCSILENLYGLYQYYVGIPEFELYSAIDLDRIQSVVFSGDFVKVIGFDGYAYGLFYNLTFYILIALALLLKMRGGFRALLAISMILSLLLISTFSERMSIIMLGVGFLCYILVGRSKGSARRFVSSAIVAIAVISVAISGLSLAFRQFEAMGGLKAERMVELSNILEAKNMLYRFAKWEEGWNALSSTMLIGDGFAGEYGYHMEYLNLAVSFGLIGFGLWVLFIGGIAFGLWRKLSTNPQSLDGLLSTVLLAFLGAMGVAAIANNPFTYSSGFVFFLLSGFVLSTRHNRTTTTT